VENHIFDIEVEWVVVMYTHQFLIKLHKKYKGDMTMALLFFWLVVDNEILT